MLFLWKGKKIGWQSWNRLKFLLYFLTISHKSCEIYVRSFFPFSLSRLLQFPFTTIFFIVQQTLKWKNILHVHCSKLFNLENSNKSIKHSWGFELCSNINIEIVLKHVNRLLAYRCLYINFVKLKASVKNERTFIKSGWWVLYVLALMPCTLYVAS